MKRGLLVTQQFYTESHSICTRLTMDENFEFSPFGILLTFDKQPPFPSPQLQKSLQSSGYQPPSQQIRIDININIDVPPEIGLRNNEGVSILYWPNEGALVVLFEDIEESLVHNTIADLQNQVIDELNVDDKDIINAQIQTEIRYWVGEDTTEYFEDKYQNVDFSEYLPTEGHPASLRLVSSMDNLPEQESGFDIRFEPFVRNTDYMFIKMQWIQPSLSELDDFVGNFDSNVKGMIEEIGGSE